jgi:4-hydroxythreonine-4-phosphate dehydrogenase
MTTTRRATPRLAVTVGDPAGIGPEVVLRALAASDRPSAEWVVYGPLQALAERAARLSLSPPNEIDARVVDVPMQQPVPLGRVSAEGGRLAAEAVLMAADDALAGRVDGLVTAPLNKESLHAAGYPWPGHTELLAERAGVSDFAMMFVGGPLKVALLTIHRSLRSVSDAVTVGEAVRVGRLVSRELPRLGAKGGRIAFCGVNPHAGEGGLFGDEDREVLAPAIAELQSEGIDARGPFPADSLFARAARGEFDAVIAAYHDQGLIPVKLLAFGKSVNVTLGLPFIRTSVDHGTGFDIAERGGADGGSLLEAMRVAVRMARWDEGRR